LVVVVTLPSPKFQVLLVIGAAETDVSVNRTVSGIPPEVGLPVKLAVTGGQEVTMKFGMVVKLLFPHAFATVNVTL
jgi:hypothetical protein